MKSLNKFDISAGPEKLKHADVAISPKLIYSQKASAISQKKHIVTLLSAS
jgi:hypothetical protein